MRFVLAFAAAAAWAAAVAGCSTASSGPAEARDAGEDVASCTGVCEAGTTCEGFSAEGYCAQYYCWDDAWVLSAACPTGTTETPSLTTSCGEGCFGIQICPFNNLPPATDVCCCTVTDAPLD